MVYRVSLKISPSIFHTSSESKSGIFILLSYEPLIDCCGQSLDCTGGMRKTYLCKKSGIKEGRELIFQEASVLLGEYGIPYPPENMPPLFLLYTQPGYPDWGGGLFSNTPPPPPPPRSLCKIDNIQDPFAVTVLEGRLHCQSCIMGDFQSVLVFCSTEEWQQDGRRQSAVETYRS